jgi:Cu(I)/Ag(I) efflux system membrane fusion protein
VYEQDIALIRTGSKAKVSISAYPDRSFNGTITYVYPTLKAETRTIPVRLEIGNPGQLLKPAMFAQIELSVGGKAKVLTCAEFRRYRQWHAPHRPRSSSRKVASSHAR